MKISLLSAALLFLAGEAAACGYCVEDKIAATYDHAVVTRALERGQHLAFFHVEGPEPRPEATRRALEDAASMSGVEKASVRISPDLADPFARLRSPAGLAGCGHGAAGSQARRAQAFAHALARHGAGRRPQDNQALGSPTR